MEPLTEKQTSTARAIVRRNVGDWRVAVYILSHGIPTAFWTATAQKLLKFDLVLETLIEELMMWYLAMLKHIVAHREQAHVKEAQQRSASHQQKQKLAKCQQALREAKTDYQRGDKLYHLKENNKRRFSDMSEEEQLLVEDFEKGVLDGNVKAIECELMALRGIKRHTAEAYGVKEIIQHSDSILTDRSVELPTGLEKLKMPES